MRKDASEERSRLFLASSDNNGAHFSPRLAADADLDDPNHPLLAQIDDKLETMNKIQRVVSIALLLLVSFAVYAQQNTAELTGNVTDANGAVLPNASVKVHQPLTGFTRLAHANCVGLYSVTQLPVGLYTYTTPGGRVTQSKID